MDVYKQITCFYRNIEFTNKQFMRQTIKDTERLRENNQNKLGAPGRELVF